MFCIYYPLLEEAFGAPVALAPLDLLPKSLGPLVFCPFAPLLVFLGIFDVSSDLS